ncbi:MAG TPA: protein-export chaperone SecB [Gammaproteobacteria bacterium]|nr:protein-export chaperone SecB [Gammaproteobacteria bacterium]
MAEPQVNFSVHNVYVKDISFEAPNSPNIFTLDWKPKLDFDIEMNRSHLEGALYEVTMKITVTVAIEHGDEANPAKQTAFIVEVKQAGVFMLEGVSDKEQIDYILSTTAPTIIFPYARQAISGLVTQGGFPQLIIPPMNFEAMYQQHLAEKSKSKDVALA